MKIKDNSPQLKMYYAHTKETQWKIQQKTIKKRRQNEEKKTNQPGFLISQS